MRAIDYLDAGLAVLPLHHKSKRARIPWLGYQDTPPDRETVLRWARKFRGCNWAVILGPPSSELIAIDFDDAAGYARWALAWPDIAQAAPTVETRRGYHVYVKGPHGQRTGAMENFDGEVKGAGGYVLLPPSVHPTGHVYRWTHGDIARFVPEVLDLRQIGIRIKTPDRIPLPARSFDTRRQPSRLKPCAASVIGGATAEGRRNVTAWRLALHLRSEGWSETSALYLLADWWARSEAAGDGPNRSVELARTVGSAYRENRTPGHGCRSLELSPYCNPACPLARFRSVP